MCQSISRHESLLPTRINSTEDDTTMPIIRTLTGFFKVRELPHHRLETLHSFARLLSQRPPPILRAGHPTLRIQALPVKLTELKSYQFQDVVRQMTRAFESVWLTCFVFTSHKLTLTTTPCHIRHTHPSLV